jgi:hypothetical protein
MQSSSSEGDRVYFSFHVHVVAGSIFQLTLTLAPGQPGGSTGMIGAN